MCSEPQTVQPSPLKMLNLDAYLSRDAYSPNDGGYEVGTIQMFENHVDGTLVKAWRAGPQYVEAGLNTSCVYWRITVGTRRCHVTVRVLMLSRLT